MSVASTYSTHYSRLSMSLRAEAKAHRVLPFDMRVALALYEMGNHATTDEVAEVLMLSTAGKQAAIRRASLNLRAAGLVKVEAHDGGKARPGVWTRHLLTDKGVEAAGSVLARVDSMKGTTS